MVEQATDPLNWMNRTEQKHLIDKYLDPEESERSLPRMGVMHTSDDNWEAIRPQSLTTSLFLIPKSELYE